MLEHIYTSRTYLIQVDGITYTIRYHTDEGTGESYIANIFNGEKPVDWRTSEWDRVHLIFTREIELA